MNDILKKIVIQKQQEIEQAKSTRPVAEVHAAVADAPAVRSFPAGLRAKQPIALIAEVKKASPSAGIIREDFHPVEIARCYEQHGAACISLLTDQHFFQGELAYLTDIRHNISLPVLRKDFILDTYQVAEARAAGADCILLIAECLTAEQLQILYEATLELGMSALIEIYEEDNLEHSLKLNPEILGVNNRNLRTFKTNLDHSLKLRKQVPETTLFVSESGIRTPLDVQRLMKHGVNAMLVGETLMRAENIGAQIDALLQQ